MGPGYRRRLTPVRADLTDVVRAHQEAGRLPTDAPATSTADVLLAVAPGRILQLAPLGPNAVLGTADARRILRPNAGRGGTTPEQHAHRQRQDGSLTDMGSAGAASRRRRRSASCKK